MQNRWYVDSEYVPNFFLYVLNFFVRIFSNVSPFLQSDDASVDDLMDLVKQIVPFHVKHNAEPEAVDLLMEVYNRNYDALSDGKFCQFLDFLR